MAANLRSLIGRPIIAATCMHAISSRDRLWIPQIANWKEITSCHDVQDNTRMDGAKPKGLFTQEICSQQMRCANSICFIWSPITFRMFQQRQNSNCFKNVLRRTTWTEMEIVKIKEAEKWSFNPIWHGLFLNRQSWGGGGMRGPHHNFVVIASMIMKFGTGVKFDVFYTMVTTKFVTSLLLRHYDFITWILADA